MQAYNTGELILSCIEAVLLNARWAQTRLETTVGGARAFAERIPGGLSSLSLLFKDTNVREGGALS